LPVRDSSRNDSFVTQTKSNEERTTKHFSKFEAGPLADMPAFVPEDSREPSPTAQLEDEDKVISSPVSEPEPQVSSLVVDRWALNRKKAADRVKNNGFDDPTATSSGTRITNTDDGDTSGEESMENRLARIKARVAELTGNIDPPIRT